MAIIVIYASCKVRIEAMTSRNKSIRALSCAAMIAGLAVAAGCREHSAPQPAQTVQSVGAPVQPYTVIESLPPRPAVIEHRRRALHLVRRDDRFYLADDLGDYYYASRDSDGHLYPAYYDRDDRQYYPLYYDADRDNYYCAVR